MRRHVTIATHLSMKMPISVIYGLKRNDSFYAFHHQIVNCGMDIEMFRTFCLGLPDTTEEFPFGPDTIVYKVKGKMFALTNIDEFASVNLKCDPELVTDLRERYPAVQPGYHMNKKHWNTIIMDNSIADKLLREWIKHSYDLVVAKLPKSKRT
jgi:predicted DNA-binding protein (MmcQ/YjbR family)